MKFVGFVNKFDEKFVQSVFFHKGNDFSINLETNEMFINYLEKSDMVFSKTLSLFDNDIFISPYMILSDGEWIWPSYYPYYIKKNKTVDIDFYDYIKNKQFKVSKLTIEQKREVIFLIEMEMLKR